MVHIFKMLVIIGLAWGKDGSFHASQTNNIIQLRTPYGTTLLMGDLGFEKLWDYEFEIPLAPLRAAGGSAGTGSGAGSGSGQGQGGRSDVSSMEDVSSLIVEANRLYNLAQFTESLRFVDEIIRRDPGNVRGWTMKGSLLHILGQKELAKSAWEKALSLQPENAELKKLLRGEP